MAVPKVGKEIPNGGRWRLMEYCVPKQNYASEKP